MKTYNALSKSFTDEVKIKMIEGSTIDEAFKLVKLDIVGGDSDEPTVTPESTPTPKPDLNIPTPAPESTPTPKPDLNIPTPSPESPTPAPGSTPTPAPGSTPTPSPGSTPAPEIDINKLTQGDGQQDGYYYVDLGLSVKWATCNVGANVASDDGLLFQFGRVDGYTYNDSNNQFRTDDQNTQDTGSSYIPLTTSGKTYNVGETLQPADDAANVNMGGAWRMPTNDQLEELLNNTTHNVVTVNGVQGMLFTSTKPGYEGKQLFIPFMQGYWYNGSFIAAGSLAYVWSSQVHPSSVNNAYKLICYSSGTASISTDGRSFAFSVRGVFQV